MKKEHFSSSIQVRIPSSGGSGRKKIKKGSWIRTIVEFLLFIVWLLCTGMAGNSNNSTMNFISYIYPYFYIFIYAIYILLISIEGYFVGYNPSASVDCPDLPDPDVGSNVIIPKVKKVCSGGIHHHCSAFMNLLLIIVVIIL